MSRNFANVYGGKKGRDYAGREHNDQPMMMIVLKFVSMFPSKNVQEHALVPFHCSQVTN